MLACLAGASRVLLADEVGLGKTIQAGLIISELVARGEAEHVLVAAPAGLCEQWRRELEDRFHLAPVLVDAAVLRDLARWPSLSEGPWQRVSLAVASLDYVKRPEVLRGMSPARYDLLVVDEAHTCARARERSAAVAWLARRSRRVVLITATPHDGDAGAFEALCRTGALPGDPPLATFRRTRRTVGSTPNRRVHLFRVRLSPPETALVVALERYAARVWRARGLDPRGRARLAMIVLAKRAASGPTALMLSLARRLEWLSRIAGTGARQLELPLATGDGHRRGGRPAGRAARRPGPGRRRGGVPGARAAGRGGARGGGVRRQAPCSPPPGRPRPRADILFTEYRDTLERLAVALAAAGPIAVLHGGLAHGERSASVTAFNEGRARLLLATDAAAHGLNLQARCRLVVNVELPWNPVRLEQRIGRVDRIGQRRRVHAVNLAAGGSCEDRVLARLLDRISRAGRCLGSPDSILGRFSEQQVAAAVFEGREIEVAGPGVETAPALQRASGESLAGDMPPGAASGSHPCAGLEDAARREAQRLEGVRLLLGRFAARSRRGSFGAQRARRAGTAPLLAALERRGPWHASVRRGRGGSLAPGLWCVCRVSIADGRGRTQDQVLLALHTGLSRSGGPPPAAPLLAAVRAELERAAMDASASRLAAVAGVLAHRAEIARAREEAMAAADQEPPAPLQPGLFDRRAVARADREAAQRECAGRRLAERRAAIGGSATVTSARGDLLLVLVVPG